MNTLKFYLILIGIIISNIQVFSQNIVEEPFAYSPELERLAEQGNADAMYKLGVCYYVGKKGYSDILTAPVPVEKNLSKAFDYFNKAEKGGSVLAMLYLGNIYSTGIGAPKGKNLKIAFDYFKKAADKGCADGYSYIGKMYETCLPDALRKADLLKTKTNGSDENMEAALIEKAQISRDYYLKAAELGSARGAYNMSLLPMGMTFNVVDYELSNKWLRKSIELGSRTAVNDLAVRYQTGLGVWQDQRMALVLYLGAARKGDPMAINNVGNYFNSGNLLPQDKETALFYFIKSDELGGPRREGLFIDHSPLYHNYYIEGIHGAKNFESEQAWLESVKKEFRGKKLPEMNIPEPRIEISLDSTFVVNDCGSWYIVDKDGIVLSERKYNKITKDTKTGNLIASINGYSTIIYENGLEESPIPEQILKTMEEGKGQYFINALEVLKVDHDNSLGYQAIAYHNIAVHLFENQAYYMAEQYLNSALEKDPELDAAIELLQYLKDNKEQLLKEKEKAKKQERKKEKREQRKFVYRAIFSGLAQMATQSSPLQVNLDGDNSIESDSSNRSKTKARVARLKAEMKENRKEMVSMGGRVARSTHLGYSSQLTDLKNNGQYGTEEFRRIQEKGKNIEKKHGLTHFEQFDW